MRSIVDLAARHTTLFGIMTLGYCLTQSYRLCQLSDSEQLIGFKFRYYNNTSNQFTPVNDDITLSGREVRCKFASFPIYLKRDQETISFQNYNTKINPLKYQDVQSVFTNHVEEFLTNNKEKNLPLRLKSDNDFWYPGYKDKPIASIRKDVEYRAVPQWSKKHFFSQKGGKALIGLNLVGAVFALYSLSGKSALSANTTLSVFSAIIGITSCFKNQDFRNGNIKYFVCDNVVVKTALDSMPFGLAVKNSALRL